MSLSLDRCRQSLERLTRTDLKYLSQSSFWLVLTQGVNVLSGLISSIVFARFVLPEQYGTYRYLLSMYGLLAIFTLPGIRTAMTRSISQGQPQALLFGIKTQMKAALIGSLVSLGVAGWYALHDNQLLAMGMLIIGVFLPFTDTLDIGSVFQGQQKFRALFLYAATVIFSSLMAALLGIWLGANPLVLLGLFLGGIALVRGIALYNIRRTLNPLQATDQAVYQQDITKFGTKLSLLSVASIAANSLDKILLFHYLNPIVVANYAFATALPNQLRALVRHIGTLALPKFSTRPEKEVYQGLLKRLPLLLGGIAILIVVYMVAAPLIFRLLFPRYLSVLSYSQLFCLSIIDSITYPISSAFTAHKKTKILTFFTLAVYLVDLLLLFLLTPSWGLQGVITAKLISRFLTVILGVVLLYRLTRSASNP